MPADTKCNGSTGCRADVGVLFIHGIGRQRRGETLARCALPLCEAIGLWAASAEPTVHVTWRARREDNQGTEPSAMPGRAGHDVPASVELVLAEKGGERRAHTWLLAESLWADCLVLPGPGEFSAWCRLAGRGLRSAWRVLRAVLARAVSHHPDSPPTCRTASGAVSECHATRVPHGAWSAKGALIEAVGNCLVGRHDPGRWTMLLARVDSHLKWLSARCERIAVVAHSVGAGIAAELLAGEAPPGNVALLVTYGAVIGSASRHLLRAGTAPEARLAGKLSPVPAGAVAPVPWLSFASDRDLFAGPPHPAAASLRISNERSFVSDHWAYWRNTEEFVLPVMTALLSVGASQIRLLQSDDQLVLAQARARRRMRGTVLAIARAGIISLLLPMLLLSARTPRPLPERARNASVCVHDCGRSLHQPGDPAPGPRWKLAAAWWLVAAGLSFGHLKATRKAWRRWDSEERAMALRRQRAPAASRARLVMWASASLAPIASLAAIALARSSGPASTSTFSYSLLAALAWVVLTAAMMAICQRHSSRLRKSDFLGRSDQPDATTSAD